MEYGLIAYLHIKRHYIMHWMLKEQGHFTLMLLLMCWFLTQTTLLTYFWMIQIALFNKLIWISHFSIIPLQIKKDISNLQTSSPSIINPNVRAISTIKTSIVSSISSELLPNFPALTTPICLSRFSLSLCLCVFVCLNLCVCMCFRLSHSVHLCLSGCLLLPLSVFV